MGYEQIVGGSAAGWLPAVLLALAVLLLVAVAAGVRELNRDCGPDGPTAGARHGGTTEGSTSPRKAGP